MYIIYMYLHSNTILIDIAHNNSFAIVLFKFH